jgi:hypothetical protein
LSNFSATILWLHQWQTLAGGLIAIIAALIGARAINRQIRQTEQHEQDRISRNFDAARSILPLTLSQLSTYVEDSIHYMVKILNFCRFSSFPMPTDKRPELPLLADGVAGEFRAIIPVSEHSLRIWIADMLAALQLQNARLLDFHTRIEDVEGDITAIDIQQCFIDAAKLGAYCAATWPYARRQSEMVPSTLEWENLKNQLSRPLAEVENADLVWKEIARREASGQRPIAPLT